MLFDSECFQRGQPHLRKISTNEMCFQLLHPWIDDSHASIQEIATVSRGDRQAMDDCRRRNEAIFDRHGFPGCAKTRQQFRPFQARVRVPGQTVETPGPLVEPAFQGGPLPSFGEDENPESEFPENDGVDGDVRLMCSKLRHHMRIGHGFRQIA